MKLFDFVFIKLALCLVIGILIGYYIPIGMIYTLIAGIVLLILLIGFHFYANALYRKTIWPGIFILAFFVNLGILIISAHEQINDNHRFTIQEQLKSKESPSLQLQIREALKPGNFHDKYVVRLLKIDDRTISGKLLLNIEKDSLRPNLQIDDIDKFLFSNFNSGQALVERGLVSREWFTLEIILKDKQRVRLVKLDAEEIEDVHKLYTELKNLMNDWFHFEVEYEELKEG